MDRFSGSEIDLANLALRVAISEHVRFQSGGAVGLLVLDEVFGPLDEERKERMREAWDEADLGVSLEVVDAPRRDLAEALLGYLRELTSDPQIAVAVVMHELRIHGPPRILHNQAALYIKRLLLFEPRVILTSVPYRLD
jgi:hypothetical protein